MRSSNPVFARSEGFNGPTTRSASGMSYPGYDAPPAPQYSQGGGGYDTPQHTTQAPVGTDRMTIDSVVQKTGITLGTTVVFAFLTWVMTGPISADAIPLLGSLAMFGALAGFALAMVNSFKKVVSPALVLAYAAVEGVFVGAFSKVIGLQFAGPEAAGLVMNAVLGTFAAVAGTLAAYKFFNIQVSDKFRKWVVAALFGFVAVMLINLVMSFFGVDFGLRGFGAMGLVVSLIGLGLGVLMLILDFDFVERGVAAGLPERESWRAAFGLAVTIIWIYIEMLRILAILRGSD
jgi:uncharacterized YccA/Bax inhibitor family protein